MYKTASGDIISGLGNYIKNEVYANFKKDRQPLEEKWQRNLDAFNAVSTGTWKPGESEAWRSDTFVQATKIKTISAYSIVTDMLLTGGKIPFTLKPSPLDMLNMAGLNDEAQERKVRDDIDDGKTLIEQQFEDCKADRELMRCVMSGAIYGETYSKRYVHVVKRSGYRPISMAPEGVQNTGEYIRYEEYSEDVKAPGVEYKSVWNIFRDLETDDLQKGIGVIERDFISAYELRKKTGGSFWVSEAIDRAIAHAAPPGSNSSIPGNISDAALPPNLRDLNFRNKTIEYLEFWGRAPKNIVEEFENAEAKKSDTTGFSAEPENDGNEVEIMCFMADNEVVRFTRMADNERPYDRALWEIKLDHTTGTGVPDNLESGQKVLNGMVRAFEDNKKLSANVQFAMKERYFAPGQADKPFVPGNKINISDECADVRMAIQQIIVQDVGETLLSGINLIERYNDESSQLPKIMQGETAEKKSPDTAYELNQLLQNAGKYLGGVIRNFDEGLIENWVSYFFRYNMTDPAQTKGKGAFIAQALGFTSFQDRIELTGKIMQFMNLVVSHESLMKEAKLRELLSEIGKKMDIDPDQYLKTVEEKQKEAQEMAQMQAQEEQKILEMNQFVKDRDHQRALEIEKLKGDITLMKEQHKSEFEQLKQEQKFAYDALLKLGAKKDQA